MTNMNYDIRTSTPLAMLTLINIQWIGQKSVIKLCNHFNSLNEIRTSSTDELRKFVPKKSIEYLNGRGQGIYTPY